MLGSSNDYCGVYNRTGADGDPVPTGPIWLGYYRSETGGASWTSSLVPGYPDDLSPYAALARIRTATAGDPVIAWDAQGRAFFGSESSGDPAGTAKTFGDVWVATFDNPGGPTIDDGKRYRGTVTVARGSSAPNLLGKFNDKTALEADHNSDGRCDNDVYFGSSHVYVVFRSFASGKGHEGDAIYYVRSTDCGVLAPAAAAAVPALRRGGRQRPGGGAAAVAAGRPVRRGGAGGGRLGARLRRLRRPLPVRLHVLPPRHPGAGDRRPVRHPTGTTYGSIAPGTGSQSAIYFLRVDGISGTRTAPAPIDNQATGHQLFPDISADNPSAASRGTLHAIWWDSRLDPCYSRARPVGNCADRTTVPSLDAWAARSTNFGASWAPARVSDVTTNPNYEQFADRTVPFAGDYLYVSSINAAAFGVWTDWRATVAGTDPREAPEDEDATTADVLQCRMFEDGAWSGDRCPRDGGLDQNIFGDTTP